MKDHINFTFKIVLSCVLSMAMHSAMPSVRNMQKLGIGAGIVCSALVVHKWRQHSQARKVLIYHSTCSNLSLESIKKIGLVSRDSVIEYKDHWIDFCQKESPGRTQEDCLYHYQAMINDLAEYNKTALGFADQVSVIFFKPEEPGVKESANFAIEVDPNKTYVYNLQHRGRAYKRDPEEDRLYRQSRVLLSDYLRYLEEAKQMVLARPGVEVRLDPETARPFYLESNDPRKKQVKVDGKWVEYTGIGCSAYAGEVIVTQRCIPPCELILLRDEINQFPYSMPVVNN